MSLMLRHKYAREGLVEAVLTMVLFFIFTPMIPTIPRVLLTIINGILAYAALTIGYTRRDRKKEADEKSSEGDR